MRYRKRVDSLTRQLKKAFPEPMEFDLVIKIMGQNRRIEKIGRQHLEFPDPGNRSDPGITWKLMKQRAP